MVTVVVTGPTTSSASFQLTATAGMSDGSLRDVSAIAGWNSSNPAVASVSTTGMVTTVGGGGFEVQATYQGVTGTVHLQVAALTVVSLTIGGAPPLPSSSFQLVAIARMADGGTQNVTELATWQSSNTQVATIAPTGRVTAVGNGDVDLGATYQGVAAVVRVQVSTSPVFTVRGTISEIAPNARVLWGARVQILSGAAQHTVSDENGVFELEVPGGRTIIEVSMKGYQPWSTEIVIDGPLTVNVALAPAPQVVAGVVGSLGTGVGSFSDLKHLPADSFKIAGDFIRGFRSNTIDTLVVEGKL